MKKKEETAYFDKQWKDMKTALKCFLKEEQQESLHDFRVQVKKIRAFLILADSAAHHPTMAKAFKPVRKIFKQAGEIRNAHMNLELGKAHKINNPVFVDSQQQLIEKSTAEFKSTSDKYLENIKKTYKALKSEIRPISNLHINMYYENQLQQIANSLAELKFDDSLHNCRTQLKVLIYNYKLTQPVLGLGFNEDYLQQAQTAIGDWHDNILAIQLFSSVEATDKAAVVSLKTQHTRLKKAISTLVKDFYNQATTVVDVAVEQID